MPRAKLLNPKQACTVQLPLDLIARVSSELFSPAEGRIPYGKWSEFIEMCVREHYSRQEPSNGP
jgi:hypothetical protein